MDARIARPRGDGFGAGEPTDGWIATVNARSVFHIMTTLSFYDNFAAVKSGAVPGYYEVGAGTDSAQIESWTIRG
jgi:hypothetical protein